MQDAHLAETQQSLGLIRPEHQQRQRQDIIRKKKLRLLCRSENWMAVLQRATVEPAGSVFIFIFAMGKLPNSKRVGAHGIPLHLINGGDFGFLDGIPEKRRRVGVDKTHSQHTSVQYSWFTSAERAHNALGSRIALPSLCAKIIVVIWCDHVSSMVVLSRAFLHEHFLFFTYLSSP